MRAPAKVVACDDHLLIGELLSVVVDDIDGLEFAGAAADGREAVELVGRTSANVLVLDLDMPGHDGLYALRRIRQFNDDVWIIVYSGMVTSKARGEVIDAGADHIVRKDDTLDSLEQALLAARDRPPRRPSQRFSRPARPTKAAAAGGRSAKP